MSGGSYDYLCHSWNLDDLLGKRHSLEQMADRLAGLTEVDFPGVTAATRATMRLVHQLRMWDTHAEAQLELLRDVWKAVEWWDSCDSGPDHLVEALAAMLTPTAAPPPTDPPADPHGPYIVTELSLTRLTADQVDAARDAGVPHPERTPVGPFPTREAADDWAYTQTNLYGGGSWSIAPLRSPA